jgi:hypothetical protein
LFRKQGTALDDEVVELNELVVNALIVGVGE